MAKKEAYPTVIMPHVSYKRRLIIEKLLRKYDSLMIVRQVKGVPDDYIMILGPLGNGFPLEKAAGKRAVVIGGGIGVPPLLETAKRLNTSAYFRAKPKNHIPPTMPAS